MRNRGARMRKSSHHPLTQPFADLRMQDYRDEVNDMPEGNDGIDAMDEPDFGDEEDPNEEEEKERITTRTLTKYERGTCHFTALHSELVPT